MDIRKIKKLIELLATTDVTEIEIKEGEELLRLSRHKYFSQDLTMQRMQALMPSSYKDPEVKLVQNPMEMVAPKIKGCHIHSPMVGTMYMARSPEAPPFVTVGQNVQAGDILCIIEAMKMFNEIEADKTGRIVEILVANGEPVEYDQPLFVMEE